VNRGLYGLLINRRLEGQAKEQINQDVNLEVYEIPDSDFSAASGTVNLPKNGKWLLVGIIRGVGNDLYINSIIAYQNDVIDSTRYTPFSFIASGSSFTYARNAGVINVKAIRLGDP
jgi:hypothetical protein